MAKRSTTEAQDTPSPSTAAVIDDVHANMPEPSPADAPEPAKLGRPMATIAHPQIGEMVKLLCAGQGRVSACATLEITYRTFLRMMRTDSGFADLIRMAEATRKEGVEANLYWIATRKYVCPIVVRAALGYLGRRDKIDAASKARRAKARRSEMDFHLKALEAHPQGQRRGVGGRDPARAYRAAGSRRVAVRGGVAGTGRSSRSAYRPGGFRRM